MTRQASRFIGFTDFCAVDMLEVVLVTGVFMRNRLCGVEDAAIIVCAHYT
ncbi:MAG: hypothetical protein H8K06_04970 [Nitrospira sp.]|nr:hypothetical protein [Nitrospira defluvii]MCS6326426.1 hypothetical protein [Nitrospira sp.]